MYRGVDVRDVALAHQLALEKDVENFEIFNISAQSIFEQSDLVDLRKNLESILEKRYPDIIDFFDKQAWELPKFIDRVYVIDKARQLLGYQPTYNIDILLKEVNNQLSNP